MGVAMAGMLVPRLRSLPDGAWEAAFGAAVGWLGWQAIRARRAGGSAAHYVPHVLASGAMVYMFLAAPPASTGPALAGVVMDGRSAASIRFPVLALTLAVALFGYVMWVTDRLPSVPAVLGAAAGVGHRRSGLARDRGAARDGVTARDCGGCRHQADRSPAGGCARAGRPGRCQPIPSG